MDTLARLAWALPLVLLVGTAAMFLLRRVVAGTESSQSERRRMCVRESLRLSDDTHAHLVAVDGETFFIVESARQATISRLNESAAKAARMPSAWIQRLIKVRAQ